VTFRLLFLLPFLLFLLALPGMSGPADPPPAVSSEVLSQALELRAAGRAEKARTLLEGHLARSPEDSRSRYLLSVILLESGEPGAGLESLLETLRRDPDMPEARASLASAVQARVYELLDRGSWGEAHTVLENLEDPSTTFFLQGAIHLEEWRRTDDREAFQRALESWARSREAKPVSAVSELLAGIAAWKSRDPDRAARRFQYALGIRGRNRYALLWRGATLALQGQTIPALEALEACRPVFGANPVLHRLLGDVHLARALEGGTPDPRLLDQAEAAYSQALELWPEDAGTLTALGRLLWLEDRLDEAMVAWSKARSLRPDPALADRLGWLLLETGRPEEARVAFLGPHGEPHPSPEGPEERQRRARCRSGAALCLAERGDPEGARSLSAEALAILDPSHPLRLLLNGTCGPSEGREEAFRQALLQVGPGAQTIHLLAWDGLARLAEKRQDADLALSALREALRLAPPESPRARDLHQRFLTLRQQELDRIASWEAHNGLVFLVDAMTGASRSAGLQTRKKALEALQPAEAGEGRQRLRGTWRPVWSSEVEGGIQDLEEVVGPETQE
jgi:tetratricopeptide (TPR) repeat protein